MDSCACGAYTDGDVPVPVCRKRVKCTLKNLREQVANSSSNLFSRGGTKFANC